jgi:hypothetical protein
VQHALQDGVGGLLWVAVVFLGRQPHTHLQPCAGVYAI